MKKILGVIILSYLLLLFNTNEVFAANAVIAPSPSTGSFDKQFTVDVVVDGRGEKFNAAQATVKIPQNITIKDLTLGDCNFSFLQTPSIQNPSFAGIIISSSSTKCTVYKLTLIPIKKGQASLKLSEASVKRYGDAAEILSSAREGSYKLTGTVNPSTSTSQFKSTSQKGLYTLYLNVSSGNSPVKNVTVVLNNVDKKNEQEIKTDNNGTAHFSNLKEGIYDAVIKQGFLQVGETIVNVRGPNKVLTLGINLDTQKNNPLMKLNTFLNTLSTNPLLLIGILFLGIVVGVVVAILVIKFIDKKKRVRSEKTEKIRK